MERVGVRELRQNASRYLRRVKSGETVEVTERGKLVALLVPPTSAATARERLIADGRLLAAPRPRYLPKRVASRSVAADTSAALDEQRGERL
ncbi:MAG: type II toxin-antitoxin system prevent-host-death family antitoxin [Nocardioidaceae bacterium]